MKTKLLYTLLLTGVLMFAGCSDKIDSDTGKQQVETSEQAARSSERPALSYKNNSPGTLPDEPQTDAGSPEAAESVRVVFLGDSITAGYGLREQKAFPALIQERLEEANIPALVVDAGSSGDTSTGGLSRIDWVLRNHVDILVLELGGNDGLRGVDLTLTQENLREIIRRTIERYPESRIIVAGMQVPTNIGHEYTATFRDIYPMLAAEFDATLIPLILEGVGGVEEMNQPDGIHPTAEGHRRIAETVWATLEPIVNDLLEERNR